MKPEDSETKKSGASVITAKLSREAMRSFSLMLFSGALAGVGFNLALGSMPWNIEGILGGLVSGTLIYAFS
jgi:hypothetical protein